MVLSENSQRASETTGTIQTRDGREAEIRDELAGWKAGAAARHWPRQLFDAYRGGLYLRLRQLRPPSILRYSLVSTTRVGYPKPCTAARTAG